MTHTSHPCFTSQPKQAHRGHGGDDAHHGGLGDGGGDALPLIYAQPPGQAAYHGICHKIALQAGGAEGLPPRLVILRIHWPDDLVIAVGVETLRVMLNWSCTHMLFLPPKLTQKQQANDLVSCSTAQIVGKEDRVV